MELEEKFTVTVNGKEYEITALPEPTVEKASQFQVDGGMILTMNAEGNWQANISSDAELV